MVPAFRTNYRPDCVDTTRGHVAEHYYFFCSDYLLGYRWYNCGLPDFGTCMARIPSLLRSFTPNVDWSRDLLYFLFQRPPKKTRYRVNEPDSLTNLSHDDQCLWMSSSPQPLMLDDALIIFEIF